MTLERRAAMATLLAERGDDLLVVPGLGSTTWDAAAVGDNIEISTFGVRWVGPL